MGNNNGKERRNFRNATKSEAKSERKSESAFHYSRGYIYTLEAAVIIAMILVSMGFIFSVPSQQPESETVNIKHQGFDSLEYLDKTGVLRRVVWESDETELESQLKPLLSKNLRYETNICSHNCSAEVTVNETIVGVNYYVADYRNIYLGKKVVLWIWRKGS